MSRADQAAALRRACSQGNALSKINDARRIGAALDVLKATDADKALLARITGSCPCPRWATTTPTTKRPVR